MDTFRSILVNIDAAAAAQPALDRAVRIARHCGAALRILDIVTAAADPSPDLITDRRKHLSRIAAATTGLSVDTEVVIGSPADAIVDDVLRFGHDLVIRCRPRERTTAGVGSPGAVDIDLFRLCPCPVWIVAPGATPEHPKLAAAVGSTAGDPVKIELNRKIVQLALLLARFQNGSVMIVQAWEPVAGRRARSYATHAELSAYIESIRRRSTEEVGELVKSFGDRLAEVPVELRRGALEEVMPALIASENVDAVVVGTFGRTGLSGRLLGNTAERLLETLPCSIVAVKPDGFRSPARARGV